MAGSRRGSSPMQQPEGGLAAAPSAGERTSAWPPPVGGGAGAVRTSGVLLHCTSLPSPYGVGDLGPAAYAWVDALARAGQTWWQVLPLGPTGYGDSPYQCFSAFAGNPLLISPELLVADGLLRSSDLEGGGSFPAERVDFERVIPYKSGLTALAWKRFGEGAARGLADEFDAFCARQAAWLEDFALFMAIKEAHGGGSWQHWPAPLRQRDPAALDAAARELEAEVKLHRFRQLLFFRQWQALRAYAQHRGVRLLGDMPIFVSIDSADVWAQPELFKLDAQRRPRVVAGVPPDYFSATGQLWGNPHYEWEVHRQTGYAWWIARLQATLTLVDCIRLDHFRGFEAAWEVPAGQLTAEQGEWVPGPGVELFEACRAAVGSLPLVAEDLGVITPEVEALRTELGLPGMRILQFAFGGARESRFLPHRFERHTVVYTGTHDNATTLGWYRGLTAEEHRFFRRYVPETGGGPAWDLIRLAWASVAECAMAPLQDILSLGPEARMNLPGQPRGNWRWRCPPHLLRESVLDRLGELTATYERAAAMRGLSSAASSLSAGADPCC